MIGDLERSNKGARLYVPHRHIGGCGGQPRAVDITTDGGQHPTVWRKREGPDDVSRQKVRAQGDCFDRGLNEGVCQHSPEQQGRRCGSPTAADRDRPDQRQRSQNDGGGSHSPELGHARNKGAQQRGGCCRRGGKAWEYRVPAGSMRGPLLGRRVLCGLVVGDACRRRSPRGRRRLARSGRCSRLSGLGPLRGRLRVDGLWTAEHGAPTVFLPAVRVVGRVAGRAGHVILVRPDGPLAVGAHADIVYGSPRRQVGDRQSGNNLGARGRPSRTGAVISGAEGRPAPAMLVVPHMTVGTLDEGRPGIEGPAADAALLPNSITLQIPMPSSATPALW